MKKLKILFSALAFVLAVGLFSQTAYAAETATVHEVEDITDTSGLEPDVYQVEAGEYTNSAYFHLDKAGYVTVTGYSNVCYASNNLGTIEHFAVYTDENCKNMVVGDKVVAIWENGTHTKKLCLEAGDYWVYFAKENSEDSADYDANSTGEFALTVAVQYLDLAGSKNTTKAKAAKVEVDEDVAGFLSNTTRTAWFAFDVKSDNTVVNIGASLENAFEGDDKYTPDYTGVTVYNSKNKVIDAFNIDSNYNSTVASKVLTLKKGTYYIKVTGDSAYDGWGDLYTLDNGVMGKVNLHITTVSKVSVSSWKNSASKKAQVTFKKLAGAEGYEIQYSTDKSFSKGVKTKKVNAKTVKATFSKLTKSKKYYVRVRAWKYDVLDENKLYGNWSAVKSVKIAK